MLQSFPDSESRYILVIHEQLYKVMENILFQKEKGALFAPKKTLFLTALCLASIALSPQPAFAALPQHPKITLVLRNVTVKEAIEALKKQSGYSFFIDTEDVDLRRQVSVDVTDKPLPEILDAILAGQQVRYEIRDKRILISSRPVSAPLQEKEIGGIIKDENGEPLAGVNVAVKGTTQGAITDANGHYSLNVSPNAVLIISYIGYRTLEIPVKGKTTVSVRMTVDDALLDEVVVVGYGVQKKVNLTGSVSTVNFSDQAESRPVTNVSSALAGLSAGVSVMQGSGQPGKDKATIRIRGLGTLNNSDPLVIIDGIEGDLNILNPNDIESVSVLKDAASASIYGSRAANGVILVTTKKGNKERIHVSYSGNVSVSKPSNLVDLVSDYPTYMRLVNESARNTGSPEIYSDKTIQAWVEANRNPEALTPNGVPNWLAYPNTNWQREMYERNIAQSHTLSVDGGSAKTSFLFSIGYMDNPGLVENTGVDRYTFRANLEATVTDWLTVGTHTYATLQNRELGDYAAMNNGFAMTSPGMVGKYNGQYGFPEAPEESSQTDNMFWFLNRYGGQEESSRFNTTVYSRVKFLKDFSWDFNFNYNRRFDEFNQHTNANPRIKFSTGEVMVPPADPGQMTTNYKNYGDHSYTLENLLRYDKVLARDHDIHVLLGYNEYYYKEYDHESTKKGLIDPSISTPGSATDMVEVKGGAKDRSLRSFFGRLNYAYQSRYLFEANMRYDGSSHFSSGSRWGIFPSFSGAWRITEEEFMKNQSLLQNLKLRLSWGRLGNNVTDGEYDYQAFYGAVKYPLNGILQTALRPKKLANALLKWENTSVANLGLDAAFLNSRLTAEMDFYHKVTDGILTTPPIYLTAGDKTAPTRNTAEVTNKGFELTLGWKDKIGEVSYRVTGNFAYNHNEVTRYKGKLKEGWTVNEKGEKVYKSNLGDVSDSKDQRRVLEGHRINEYYLLSTYRGNQQYFNADGSVNRNGGPKDGVIRTEADMEWLKAMQSAGYKFMPNQGIDKNQIWYGDLIYADSNDDGIYGNTYDNRLTGSSATPAYNFGLELSASWNRFDVSMLWAGSAGFDLYWAQFGFNQPSTRYGSAIGQRVADNHYYYNEGNASDPTPNRLDGLYPRLRMNENDAQNKAASTFYLYKGDFLKLKNLSVGYTLPAAVSKKVFAERIRLYFSGENLLTITSFPGQDPEIGSSIGYPSLKQISFGANITF